MLHVRILLSKPHFWNHLILEDGMNNIEIIQSHMNGFWNASQQHMLKMAMVPSKLKTMESISGSILSMELTVKPNSTELKVKSTSLEVKMEETIE